MSESFKYRDVFIFLTIFFNLNKIVINFQFRHTYRNFASFSSVSIFSLIFLRRQRLYTEIFNSSRSCITVFNISDQSFRLTISSAQNRNQSFGRYICTIHIGSVLFSRHSALLINTLHTLLKNTKTIIKYELIKQKQQTNLFYIYLKFIKNNTI